MQTAAARPAAPPARKSGNAASNGPKSNKKKKPQSKSNAAKEPAGPPPVAPPPVSGPWSNPAPVSGGAPPPGFAPSPPKPANAGFSDAHQRLLRHRALFAFRFLVGKAVELQLVASNERYAGLLDCVDPDDFSVVLKSTKRLSAGPDAKPFEDGSTVIFRRHQLAHLVADGSVDYTEAVFASAGAAAGGFRTDTEISGQRGEHLFGRELEVASSWLDPALDTGALEDGAPNGRRHGKNHQGKAGWNQFEANEKLFGVVSSYDENIYTTKLDKTKISTEQSRAAERLAQEIERQSAAGNFHLQEERGQKVRGGKHANDLDEEARYSSVDRSATGDAYVPPALRNAQRQSSGGKAKATKTPLESTPAPATTPAPAISEPASAAGSAPVAPPAAPAAPKPLSFSEAVTGRSAAPASASKAVPKSQPDEKASSPQKAAAPAQVNGKDAKPAAVKSKSASPKKKEVKDASQKKEANGGKEKKGDSKTEESKATTTATKPSKEEAPKATPKKALNPNAKEFKLNAGAVAFTPSFATPPAPAPVVKEQVSSPYRGGSPGPMPYPHPGMGYPPPMQEEWMYDGGMGGEEGGEMSMPPYGYGVPMGPNGVPMMYPPMMPQRMMGGQRGGYGGYQQGYNPRGYYSPPNGGYPAGGMPYAGGPGGVGPQPPLPREPTPSGDESPSEPAADGAPAPPVPEAEPAVESAPASSKQAPAASKKK